jgi:16S rRNA (cytosine1402-N4)-methyltransferase
MLPSVLPTEADHVPVLADEVLAALDPHPGDTVVDCTFGSGGHSQLLLGRLRGEGKLIAVDRDPTVRPYFERLRRGSRVRMRLLHGEFSTVLEQLANNGVRAEAILLDLGVSSMQLDRPERGFSYAADAPLDMRMDPTRGETAAQFLGHVDQHQFVRLLRENGESRFAGSIAKSVLERQPQTTNELTDAVERAVPMAARRRGHVATRVFQALRVAVNSEADELIAGLDAALDALVAGGLVAVISYHSGEDRVVKSVLHEASTGGCHCPPELGCVCGAVPRVTVFKASARLASQSEIDRNPRARSARLRVARKL